MMSDRNTLPVVLMAALATTIAVRAPAEAPADAAAVESPPATVAGRGLDQWTADVDSDDRVVRLRAIRSLGLFDAAAGDALVAALASDDAAVRYVASVQLGRIGGATLDDAVARLQSLRDDDQQPAVQLAAAYALCQAHKPGENLDLLTDRLGDSDPSLAISAAELLGMLGPAAKAAAPALRHTWATNRAAGQGDPQLGAAARSALRRIEPDAMNEGP